MAKLVRAKNPLQGPITFETDADGKLIQISRSFECGGGFPGTISCAPTRLYDHVEKDAANKDVLIAANLTTQFDDKDCAALEALLAKLNTALVQAAEVD